MEKVAHLIIKDDIKNSRKENINEIWLMAKYCLETYIHSIWVFGIDSSVTKKVREIWKNFLGVLKEERLLTNFILKNSSNINLYTAEEFIDMLDDLNDDTINYYYDYLDSIDNACDMQTVWRAVPKKKDYDMLNETSKYREMVIEMLINMDDVKTFLNLPEDFWTYIIPRTLKGDDYDENDQSFYGINMRFDDNEQLCDLKLIVPKIINLRTALINVHEYKRAYSLYKLLGQRVDRNIAFEDSIQCQKAFQTEYMQEKYKVKF